MSTNDETIEVTTGEETVTPRSVSVLLNILDTENTYQGMSDEEIQSIVNYKEQLAYQKGKTDQCESDQKQYHANMLANTQLALQNESEMLKSIIDRASNPVLKVVQYG